MVMMQSYALQTVAQCLAKNKVVANLKRSQIKCILCEAGQNTSKPSPLEIKIDSQRITESERYENLEVTLDKNHNFNYNLDKTFKKISSSNYHECNKI